MKNTIVLFVCALAITTAISCGDHSSGSSSSDFKIKPDTVSQITPNLTGRGTSFNVTFDGQPYAPGTADDYAIILSNVNNIGNVGIAFGTNPMTNRSFKVFIYYEGDISTGNKSGTVTVIEDGTRDTASFNNVGFTFSAPDGNNVYTITIDDITVGSKTLKFNELKAYLVQ